MLHIFLKFHWDYLDADAEDDIIKDALASSEDASEEENQKQKWS